MIYILALACLAACGLNALTIYRLARVIDAEVIPAHNLVEKDLTAAEMRILALEELALNRRHKLSTDYCPVDISGGKQAS